MERIRSANLLLRVERTQDAPPDYVAAVKMKEKEDEELPTYSEAVIGDTDIECVNDSLQVAHKSNYIITRSS